MKTTYLLLFLILSFSCVSQNKNSTLAENYLSALRSTLHGETTQADLDQLIKLYDEQIVYEHPKVGIKLEGSEVIANGLQNFLNSYGGSQKDVTINGSTQILKPSMSAIEFELSFLLADGSKVTRQVVTILEFKEEKITRIIEYW